MSKFEFGLASHGRGGVGNIDTAAQAKSRVAGDLEANRLKNDPDAQAWSPTDYMQRQEPSYIGRGGAGNYGNSKDLSVDSNVEGSPTKVRTDGSPQSPTYGRGGAGNFAAGTAAIRRAGSRKVTEDEMVREKLNKDIEEGVNESLAMPVKAKLPPPQKAKLPDDEPI